MAAKKGKKRNVASLALVFALFDAVYVLRRESNGCSLISVEYLPVIETADQFYRNWPVE